LDAGRLEIWVEQIELLKSSVETTPFDNIARQFMSRQQSAPIHVDRFNGEERRTAGNPPGNLSQAARSRTPIPNASIGQAAWFSYYLFESIEEV
jgi:hypothetical protein